MIRKNIHCMGWNEELLLGVSSWNIDFRLPKSHNL